MIVTGFYNPPEITPINIQQGWSYIAYLRITPMSVADALSSIVNDIIIVKDDYGQMYWPIFGVNLIDYMYPGEGYQIKMSNSATLFYPANTANTSKSNIEIPKPKHYKNVKITGNNMSLMIPNQTWDIKPEIGSEIGIFSQNGLLVGAGVYTGENLAITIWGDDELSQETDGQKSNEEFLIKLWTAGEEQSLQIVSWIEGDKFYETNKISIAKKLSIINYQLSIAKLFQNVPNPFSKTTEISFYLPEKAFVEIELFSILGEKIESIEEKNYSHGKHTIVYDKKNLSSGVYFYRLNCGDFSDTRIMNVE